MTAAALYLPPDIRLLNAVSTLLFVIAAAALMALGVGALGRAQVFAIRSIQIEGDVHRNSAATIRAHAMPQLAGNLFTIDLPVARAVFQSVPWVRAAVVRRVWPDQLAVRLEEHQVAALWGSGEGIDRLVNTHGELFDANLGDIEDDSLPTLSGPEASAAQVFAMYQRLGTVVQPLRARIETLALSGRGSWRMTLDTGARIELGRGTDDEVVTRTALFVRTLPQLTARYERPLVAADLRHRDGYAVRLKDVVTLLDIPPGAAPGAKPTDRR